MRPSKNLQRCYILLAVGWLLAAAYFLLITLPLIREKSIQDAQLSDSVNRLAEAGHGMSGEEVRDAIERIQADIDAFAELGTDRARKVRFSGDVEGLLSRPFQLLDFDHRKFLFIDRIRGLGREKKVALFEDWERRLPVPGSEEPYLLWAQLTVMDQLIRTAMEAGVERIDEARLITGGAPVAGPDGEVVSRAESEVSVQMRLTGKMEAIHSVIMMLPLNGEELTALGINGVAEPKSSFFLSRFLLTKSSPEAANEVSLEFVASGFLEAAPNP